MNNLIPKVIHISWKSKDIVNSNHIFPKNTIQKLIELSPNWKLELSDDQEVNQYLKDNLETSDYNLIKTRHIVEKCDLWRLIKLYIEGGVYVDIDRLCNIALDDILDEKTKFVLPICKDYDFSQDFMCSAPKNPIFLETINLNLSRRRAGINNIYFLGPQTYTHGILISLFGTIIEKPDFGEIRKILENADFIRTYNENPPYDTIIYRNNTEIIFDHENMKKDFYAKCELKHWTGDW
jgi:hypothetical protein